MSTSKQIELLRKIVRELIQQELGEASTTGNLDGGAGPPKTPYAFQSKPKSKKDKDKEDDMEKATGYTKVNEAKFHVKTEMGSVIVDASGKAEAIMKVAKALKKGRKGVIDANRVGVSKAKQVSQKLENVTEGKYHDWRNDETMTPKQKIGKSVREVRHALDALDKTIKMNVRLKNELNVDSRNYWKTTHKALSKISERLVKLATKVGSLK
jgi:hypothetical protein|tara:strand:- start:693 stop:1325 length:633 start_codon:yes stop_codon:yes gene_type:complete